MASTTNLTQFCTDIANAIRARQAAVGVSSGSATTGVIAAANFDTEIARIGSAPTIINGAPSTGNMTGSGSGILGGGFKATGALAQRDGMLLTGAGAVGFTCNNYINIPTAGNYRVVGHMYAISVSSGVEDDYGSSFSNIVTATLGGFALSPTATANLGGRRFGVIDTTINFTTTGQKAVVISFMHSTSSPYGSNGDIGIRLTAIKV